ncbi:MAG: hypothetical protein A2Z46_03190 [Nitrospirae bacterium RBG_19FT_COMBO_55_12]|nr:MAG: hypothetical protein A2Z46_03190 [Nitrospirae bacterium RBG_19FT_COMBO_55_12]
MDEGGRTKDEGRGKRAEGAEKRNAPKTSMSPMRALFLNIPWQVILKIERDMFDFHGILRLWSNVKIW